MRRAITAICCALLATGATADEGYELYEWGVFSVPRGSRWAQRDMRQEWKSFPKFFVGTFPGRTLPYNGPVYKPVIYLRAKTRFRLGLTVRFSDGRPLIWWPPASKPSAHELAFWDRKHLGFSLLVSTLEEARKADNRRDLLRAVAADHWVARLRKVDASLVVAKNDRQAQTERFVYYDGLMKAPKPAKATRDGDAIVLATDCDHDWHDALVVERRGGRVYASPWIDRIAKGARTTRVPLVALPAGQEKAGLTALGKALVAKLVAAGLRADQAEAMVDVWRKGLFDRPGLQAFYRLPRATYDRWLPLTAEPKPARSARVGLVIHPRLEPELPARIDALIGRLASPARAERQKARAELASIGGAAFPKLEAAIRSATDRKVVERCRELLDALDAGPLLEAKK